MGFLKVIFTNRLFLIAIRIIIGITFIWASMDKIMKPGEFAINIYNYRMLPYWTINLMAIIMPWMELICGVLIIVGFFWRGSAFLIGAMLLVFIIALSSAIARGLDISCGCFSVGEEGHAVGLDLLIRDILMLIGIVIMLVFGELRWRLVTEELRLWRENVPRD
ncbi:MAG: MauE/DoxX family redox-associated membrane protein [bacterium]